MAVTNRGRVGRAMDIFATGLAPFVERQIDARVTRSKLRLLAIRGAASWVLGARTVRSDHAPFHGQHLAQVMPRKRTQDRRVRASPADSQAEHPRTRLAALAAPAAHFAPRSSEKLAISKLMSDKISCMGLVVSKKTNFLQLKGAALG
jgi:hypothetical protein